MEPQRSEQQDPTPSPQIEAPFTDEQVEVLNLFQASGVWHPYTSERGVDLIATREGWRESSDGPVVQTWAHAFSANRPLIEARAEILRGASPLAQVAISDLPTLKQSELRAHFQRLPDGFIESHCFLHKEQPGEATATVYHRQQFAALPGINCNGAINWQTADGREPLSPEEATHIEVRLVYLPKFDPTFGTRRGNVTFVLPSTAASDARELALLFGYTVNEGHTAREAFGVLQKNATERGLVLESLATEFGDAHGAGLAE